MPCIPYIPLPVRFPAILGDSRVYPAYYLALVSCISFIGISIAIAWGMVYKGSVYKVLKSNGGIRGKEGI